MHSRIFDRHETVVLIEVFNKQYPDKTSLLEYLGLEYQMDSVSPWYNMSALQHILLSPFRCCIFGGERPKKEKQCSFRISKRLNYETPRIQQCSINDGTPLLAKIKQSTARGKGYRINETTSRFLETLPTIWNIQARRDPLPVSDIQFGLDSCSWRGSEISGYNSDDQETQTDPFEFDNDSVYRAIIHGSCEESTSYSGARIGSNHGRRKSLAGNTAERA